MAYPHPVLLDLAKGWPIDPSRVDVPAARSAIEHRVAAILLDSLGDGLSSVHPEAAEMLMAFDMAVEARRPRLVAALDQIHARLMAEGIDHVAFKGVASACRWYDDPTDRPFNDLDVVVEPAADITRAVAAIDPGNPNLELFTRGGTATAFAGIVVDGTAVDLHAEPFHMGIEPRDPEAWWSSTILSDSLGTEEPMRVFEPNLDLVLFVLHQARDRFRYLLGVIETRLRLRQDLEWHKIESLARAEGIWEQVGVGLSILCDEAGIASPIQPPSNWRTRLWRFLWRPKVRLLGEAGRFRHIRRATWLMPLLTTGRAIESVTWLVRSAFPTNTDLRLRHPKARGPYLWRLVASRLSIIGHRRLRSARDRRSIVEGHRQTSEAAGTSGPGNGSGRVGRSR